MNKRISTGSIIICICICFLYTCTYRSYTTHTSGLEKDQMGRNTCLRYIRLSLYDTTNAGYTTASEHFFTAGGYIDSVAGNISYYDHYIYPLSTSFLVYQKNGQWVYRNVDSTLLFRDHYEKDHLKQSTRIRFDTAGRTSYIRVRYDWPLKTQIKYYYDRHGLLSMRLLVLALGPTYVERYVYNEKDQIIQMTMYDVIRDSIERPFIRLDYSYYKDTGPGCMPGK